MGDLRIRRARAADLDAIDGELGQRRFFADRLARQHERLGMLLTAWLDARPIGVIYLWLEAAEEPELREHLPGTPILTHLEIHPRHRGRGHGSLLIAAAERRLRMLGHERVTLAVEIGNRRAEQLYIRLGYVEWPHSTVKCYSLTDGNGQRDVETCLIMVKGLREVQVRDRVRETQRAEDLPHPGE